MFTDQITEEDVAFLLDTQIPLVEALYAKKRALASKFAIGGKKIAAEALAAIPQLPDLTPAHLSQFSALARAYSSQRTCSHEEKCVARSASLLGCSFALLWHPEELQMDVAMGAQCMSGGYEDAIGMRQLGAMWGLWVMCSGGTVVASTAARGSLSGDAPMHEGSLQNGGGEVGDMFPSQVSKDAAGALPVVGKPPDRSVSLFFF
jgi:hypothetical protein